MEVVDPVNNFSLNYLITYIIWLLRHTGAAHVVGGTEAYLTCMTLYRQTPPRALQISVGKHAKFSYPRLFNVPTEGVPLEFCNGLGYKDSE